MSTVTWDAILVTVDGFGFGTLTGESCLKNVHSHTVSAWGGGGGAGGIPWGGGGVGEPRTGIIDGEAGCLRLKETTLTMSRLPIRLGWNELTTYLLALHYVFV